MRIKQPQSASSRTATVRTWSFYSILVATLTCVTTTSCWAVDLYVSATGSDTNPGTASAPLKTLQAAAGKVTGAGTHVKVRSGNYVGFNYGWNDEPSGTIDQPIVFEGIEAGVTITQRNAKTPDGINIENVRYITVQGFTVKGMPRSGIRTAVGDHITIRNNICDGNGVWGILTGHVDDLLIEDNVTSNSVEQHGIYVGNSPKRPVIQRNSVFGNGASGIQINADLSQGGDGICKNALIQDNVIYNNGKLGGAALNMDGVQDSVFRNNVLYNNHASGIALFRQDAAEPSINNTVVNNTIVQASDGRWAITVGNNSTGTTLFNNILLTNHSFRGSLSACSTCRTNLLSDYNLAIDRFTLDDGDTILTRSQWAAATGQDQNSKTITASVYTGQFQDLATWDLRLTTGAAAVDSGLNSRAPSTDILGVPRPQAAVVDIGAFELLQGSNGGPTPTPTPTQSSPPGGATPTPTATSTPRPSQKVQRPVRLFGIRNDRGEVSLRWRDRSSNEDGFEIWVAHGRSAFRLRKVVRPDVTRATFSLSGSARTRSLRIHVRAFRIIAGVRVSSAYTNVVALGTRA